MTPRSALLMGAGNAFLAVALGAFGAHGLRQHVDADLLAVWQTGVQYQFGHALALVLVGLLLERRPAATLDWSGRLLATGCVLFSGSLYLLVLSGQRWLGAVTPLGGVAFLAGWLLLGVAAYRHGTPA